MDNTLSARTAVPSYAAGMIAVSPLFYFSAALITSQNFWPVFLLVCCFATTDIHVLSSRGLKTPWAFWGFTLVPVYLWQRARITGQGKALFWLWFCCLILSMLAQDKFESARYREQLADVACPVATRLLKEQLSEPRLYCLKILVTKKVSPNRYLATVKLNSDADLQVWVETRENNRIAVSALPESARQLKQWQQQFAHQAK